MILLYVTGIGYSSGLTTEADGGIAQTRRDLRKSILGPGAAPSLQPPRSQLKPLEQDGTARRSMKHSFVHFLES